MKFVYFGYDFMIGGVQRLLDEGHELCGVFTFECDNVFNFNREIIALAERRGAPVILSAAQSLHIESFIREGAKVFLAAGYPYKIPAIPEEKAYGLNLHPSALPKGRGFMPTPYIIMDAPEAAGMTLHKLTAEIDAGDTLAQEKFDIGPRESVETYSARIAVSGPDMLAKIFADLPGYWEKAQKQDEEQATYFPPPTEEMRTLSWDMNAEEMDRRARAFGHFGVLAEIEGRKIVIYSLECWAQDHDFKPGSIAAHMSREMVIALPDGFACIKNFQNLGT